MSEQSENVSTSLILKTAIRYLLPLLFLFSLFVLFRGHNEPGGGFVGGLVAASAFALYQIGYGVVRARELLRLEPLQLIALGLLLAVGSGLAALYWPGGLFMTALWPSLELPVLGKLGTPLFFDIGVYLTVIGVVTLIIFSLSEEG